MLRLRSAIFLGLLLILFLEIWIGFPVAIETTPPDRRPLAEDDSVPQAEQKMTGAHVVEARDGRRDWELFSETAETYDGKGTWKMEKVRVLFYNDKQAEFTVVGDRGGIEQNRDMRIEGNVRIDTANGYVIRTNAVTYFAAKRMIESPGEVLMTGERKADGGLLTVKGASLVAFVDAKEVEIHREVFASHPLKGKGLFKVHAKKAFFRTTDRSARFEDDVRLSVDSMSIEGPKAVFSYRDNVDLLQSIRIEGGVKMRDTDRFATSDAVRFDPEANSYILTGKPRIVQDRDEITGEQIVFIDGGRKIKVEKMKAKVEREEEE